MRLASPKSLRGRVHEVLDQTAPHDRMSLLVHRVIIALVLLIIVAVVLESVPSIDAAWHRLFLTVEIVTVTAFTLEYALRLWGAPEHPPLAGLAPWESALRYALYPASIIDLSRSCR